MATPSTDLHSFHAHLLGSRRILALLGAGLSASSGLPTFRGAGGLWRTHSAPDLATPEAFAADPGLVWQFYNYRRHMALAVSPNPAHYALAELARRKPGFQCLSQNVDGLSPRAGHPEAQLQLLHGSLFEVKCVDGRRCGYRETNFADPIVPALAIPQSGEDLTSNSARDLDISNIATPLPHLKPKDLPTCPHCTSLLRPAVVWFGESLPRHVLQNINTFLSDSEPTDLIIVIGTSAQVFPAAGYIQEARDAGARVCVVNMDAQDSPPTGWTDGDWFFQGDAAEIVPRLLGPIVGDARELIEKMRAKV
ncbi:Sir2 family [Teratosphaeria destructans]|uniref:Sir2 family n=1 Tax=Teratosphaeria destructans TaxID=418781 RepID=A0A9W7W132_9PEZI|nr:Sir2 family [Teratosphaeria destructans]